MRCDKETPPSTILLTHPGIAQLGAIYDSTVKILQLIKGRLLQLAASDWGKDILIYSSALKQK